MRASNKRDERSEARLANNIIVPPGILPMTMKIRQHETHTQELITRE